MSKVVEMYGKFESLPEEKKKRIIDICVEEFSQNGYKSASTNTIVKNAEISKGILFHYFGNKKSLYLYILDYSIDLMMEVVNEKITGLPADFFERIIKIGVLKLKIAYEYPAIYKILLDAFTHEDADIKQDIQRRYEKMYENGIPMIYKDIDTSGFRKDIDGNRAVELVMFALEGVSNKYMKLFQNKPVDEIMSEMESVMEDYNVYIEILKKVMCEN